MKNAFCGWALRQRNLSLSILFIVLLLSPGSYAAGIKEEARVYRQEGYKMQSLGDLEGALVRYEKAAQLDPLYVEVYNDLGVVYEALGQNDEALKSYKKCLSLDVNYLSAYTNLAFLYEKIGDASNANYYWQKRYELGQEGEYWREVACQHLIALGIYPEVKRDQMEKQALKLSKELVYKREQERLKVIEEASLHFDIGSNLFFKGDYSGALKEFETALSLEPNDKALKEKIADFYKKTKNVYSKEEALSLTRRALDYIKNDDFLSATESLKNAITAVSQVSVDKKDKTFRIEDSSFR